MQEFGAPLSRRSLLAKICFCSIPASRRPWVQLLKIFLVFVRVLRPILAADAPYPFFFIRSSSRNRSSTMLTADALHSSAE